MSHRYLVEPMALEDVHAVGAVEREAFGERWPPSSFRHDLLENRLLHYLVLRMQNAKCKMKPPHQT
ncbi:MAG: hypothetical protein HYY05_05255 [Chloroflexi bacterium]|nr:hypothetical protein [Chloroflexota bacterium]